MLLGPGDWPGVQDTNPRQCEKDVFEGVLAGGQVIVWARKGSGAVLFHGVRVVVWLEQLEPRAMHTSTHHGPSRNAPRAIAAAVAVALPPPSAAVPPVLCGGGAASWPSAALPERRRCQCGCCSRALGPLVLARCPPHAVPAAGAHQSGAAGRYIPYNAVLFLGSWWSN